MVTRLEATDSEGAPLKGQNRYRLPNDEQDFALIEYVSSLFFAPENYYRLIAFVVSDQFNRMDSRELTEQASIERLRRGALRLPLEYKDREFTENHRIDALIYEFRTGENQENIEMVLPGRISAEDHFRNSGLSFALFQ